MGKGRGAGRSLFVGIRVTLQRHPKGDGTLIVLTKGREDGWDAYTDLTRRRLPDLLEVRSTPDALRVLAQAALELADEMEHQPETSA